jgi:hypothetical protein
VWKEGVNVDANNMILNRFFTQNTFCELINENKNATYYSAIKRYLNDVEYKCNKMLISEIYNVMIKNYRNEYFYKNTLLNKLLLGRHNLRTTTALTEVVVNKSKADFVLINGKAVVYEIKTELDNFDRLDSQLNNYYKAFNNVYVVTCESNFERIKSVLADTSVGICILTDKNTISTRRSSVEDSTKLEYNAMFKILRKKEFENILSDYYGGLPVTKQVNYYSECYKLFRSMPLDVAYQYFLGELKKRNKIEIESYQHCVPYELKFLIYFSKYNKSDYLKLYNFLENKFGG